MSRLARFLEYVQVFELAQASDDFSLIERFFAEDAAHFVEAAGPLAADDHGRSAVVAGLQASVHRIDRRFDLRVPEILDGPVVRPDGIWMRFGLRLVRAGLPDLCLEGEHLTVYDETGAIVRIDEKLLDGCDAAAEAYLERYAAELRPEGQAPAMPDADGLTLLRDGQQRSLARVYGQAKSLQDIEAALLICHPAFQIETVPFGITTRDREDTRAQLGVFFSVFPDYRAETDGLASGSDGAAWWGRISMTFAGAFLGHAPTGKRSQQSAVSIYEFRDGLLVRERFFFDLGTLCEGIGLPLAEFRSALATLRGA